MKAVILAGGLGTRMREETEFRPKPMVEIGGRPILWHIMKGLSAYGLRDFIVVTGYRSNLIKEYFLHYASYANDFSVQLATGRVDYPKSISSEEDWKVTVADTGAATPTGGRIHRVASYLRQGPFLVTYGDGLSDVDISALIETHRVSGAQATITAVRPTSRFGQLKLGAGDEVVGFTEKPIMEDWVNGGFMVMEPSVLDLLHDESVLEGEPLAKLASEGHLAAYRHHGFWQPMDTYREYLELSDQWERGQAPWKTWT
jgi:glucose-1-phosphate cytidylyltransferase